MSSLVSKEIEDQIDKLERALKISRRKGQHDKVIKITAELDKIRGAGTNEPNGQEEKSMTSFFFSPIFLPLSPLLFCTCL